MAKEYRIAWRIKGKTAFGEWFDESKKRTLLEYARCNNALYGWNTHWVEGRESEASAQVETE